MKPPFSSAGKARKSRAVAATASERPATAHALASAMHRLSKMGKVDFRRVMFLRTASNYCMQPPNMDVNKSLHTDMENGYAGYMSSLEAAYRAGSRVVHELAGNWDKYRDSIPAP